KQHLPEYMVPSQFVFLERLPLTVHGKVDRKALPAPGRARPELGVEFASPSTPAEKALAAIWESVLQVERVGVNDNFFALGGDSIRSIQVIAQALAAGVSLTLEELFARPTIYELVRSAPAFEQERVDGSRLPFSAISEAERGRLPTGLEDAYPMAELQTG